MRISRLISRVPGFAAILCLAATLSAAPVHIDTLAELKADQKKTLAVADKMVAATVGLAPRTVPGMGSGVIVSKDGLILTAGHVLPEPGAEVLVYMSDGRRVRAKALGVDRTHDAGMVQITEPGTYPFVEMGRSANLTKGQWCLAVGHPGGVQKDRKPPVRLGRLLSIGDGGTMETGLISDCTVISGDSGGPLFDLDGRVVGIHSNISVVVTENRHVPIDVYRREWDDLLASKSMGKPDPAIAHGLPGGGDGGRFRRGGPGGGAGPVAGMAQRRQKFNQLLQQKLAAGDPVAREFMSEAMKHRGRVELTPEKMDNLISQWESKEPAGQAKPGDQPKPADPQAKPDSDADASHYGTPRPVIHLGNPPTSSKEDGEGLAELMKHTKPDGHGRMRLDLTPELAQKYGPLLAKLNGGGGFDGRFGDTAYAKGNKELLADFTPLVAGASAAEILCDGKPAALGCVVGAEGLIVTKASEMRGAVTVRIGGRTYAAAAVQKDQANDLALLKIDAKNLKPVEWSDAAPPLGEWLIAPGPDGKALAVGVVGVAPRKVPPHVTLDGTRNKAVIGVSLDPFADRAVVLGVVRGSGAAAAGVLPGDVITAVDGRKVKLADEATQEIGKHGVGETLALEIRRGEETKELHARLKPAPADPTMPDNNAVTQLSSAGGSLSKRRGDFPTALTHDCVLQANQIGGPLLDLDGHALALNIARADRTATYAIPAAALKPVIAQMIAKAGKS